MIIHFDRFLETFAPFIDAQVILFYKDPNKSKGIGYAWYDDIGTAKNVIELADGKEFMVCGSCS